MQTQSSVNGQNATCLNWTREDQPDLYFYEMIQHAANGVDRARTWQWFRNDKCHPAHPDRRAPGQRDWKGWTDTTPPRD